MEQDRKARKRMSEAKWDGLQEMTTAYAREAIGVARVDFHENLTGDTGSLPETIDRLERVLNRLCPAPNPLSSEDSDWYTLLWGSYFGELLRRAHGGEWEMSIYPGTDFSVPTLVIEGSRMYPMMKVFRRLSMGAGESLPAFYDMMAARLEAAARKREAEAGDQDA
jgi:hypothetical protein